MKRLTIIFLLWSSISLAQTHAIAHFSVWKPKPGDAENFENGYKQHLLWHIANKDSWNWYGWYIISGPRDGYFIDASFDHNWEDFDHPVNPTGDEANNQFHTEPFADFLRSYKVELLPFSDTPNKLVLTSRYLRMLTVDLKDKGKGQAILKDIIAKYRAQNATQKIVVFNPLDGGNIMQVIVLVPFNNFAEMAKMEIFNDLLGSSEIVTSLTSETLLFKGDMSLNAN